MKNVTVYLDMETEAIGPRPHAYPPKPVGYAYKTTDKWEYVSWGHPGKNNHTFKQAQALLEKILSRATHIVCHNVAFDREVCQTHMKLDNETAVWHDMMILAYLDDPHQALGLKPLAVKHCGMDPLEQDAVREWLEANGIIHKNQKDWGAHIAKAPASVVGPYAMGDVARTEKLYKKFSTWHDSEAYLRELELIPIISEMERQGVLLDVMRLERDVDLYFKRLDDLDNKIKKFLGNVDVDHDGAIATALDTGKLLKKPLPVTEKGALSVNKKAFIECVNDKTLLGHMLLRNSLATCLRTFMQP